MIIGAVRERRREWLTWCGLVIALGGPFITYLAFHRLLSRDVAGLSWGLLVRWCNLAALVAYVLWVERRPLASIGLRTLRWWTLPLGIAAGVLLFASQPLTAMLNRALGLGADTHLYAFLVSLPFWLRVLLVLTAGVFEEALFRGYAIERLIESSNSRWLAGIVTVAAFTLAHAPAIGFAHLLPVLVVSILITLLYLWGRDLICNMTAHVVIDGIALLVLPALH